MSEICMFVQNKNRETVIYRDNSKNIKVGFLKNLNQFYVTEVSPDKQMYYSPGLKGWIDASNITVLMQDAPTEDKYRVIYETQTRNTGIRITDETEQLITGDVNSSNTSVLAQMSASDTRGIFGMPYQFMPSVDRRFGDKDSIGRKFADKILSRNNILYITPGRQEFMPGASAEQRGSVMNMLMDTNFEINTMDPEEVINFAGRYYSLAIDTKKYYDYVNTAASATAVLMGIGDEEIFGPNKKLKNMNWQEVFSNPEFKNDALGVNDNILFYVDGLNSVSESFGNQTRESSLVSQINGYSDTVKEINYIMNFGNDKATLDALSDQESYTNTMNKIQGYMNNFASGTGVLQAILGNGTTILSGGKLVFPELWSDSDFDRSYSVDIKLRSPDADDVSIFLNIIVPYIHLMALTAPRDFEGTANSNGYVAPFLVRAFFRSLFNIDMGIITDLSVTRGGEGNWAATNNLPTSIDVSITIKDLYNSMYMTNGTIGTGGGLAGSGATAKFIANDSEMQQLMTLSGCESQKLIITDKMKIYNGIVGGNLLNALNLSKNALMDKFHNAMQHTFIYR